jgi:hypothetical protein
MGSDAVQGQLWGTVPREWAEIAETLVRLSCGVRAGVVRVDGDVMPARGFERRGCTLAEASPDQPPQAAFCPKMPPVMICT